ncbi:MAG: group II intron reverse transcriptase/maturase [Sphaerospermopsis sp. SIO1G1]|nr:group II intron reverse transcriptase/maturase [Sphaerospermopsis sp. SIO1G1]
MTNTSETTTVEMEWANVNWKAVNRALFRLQKRIYKASQNGDFKTVRKLQKLLVKSHSAKLTAVRKVTQDNRGKNTPGIDGVAKLAPHQRLELVQSLKLDGKSQPVRRIEIPKPGKKEKRPLGIPTIEDRAKQALAKLALEPEWEAKFEANSYGFRPGRSAKDAIAAIYSDINKMSYYVLDADIEKCFDQINHKRLLDKLNTYPGMRRQIKTWLKSGVIAQNVFYITESGTPQGGVISPLLANIALHGMQEALHQAFPKKYTTKAMAQMYGIKPDINFNPPLFHRYADDFVIFHKSKKVIEECREIINDWLKFMGLKLKDSKTRIAHTLGDGKVQSGFDYLSFNIRQYPVKDINSATDRKGKKLGFKTLIKPSKEAIKRHIKILKQTIRKNRNATQEKLIEALTPKIRGWSNYYDSVVSSRVFGKVDNILYHQLLRWGYYCAPMQGKKHTVNKYWGVDQGLGWVFITPDGQQLRRHKDTHVKRVIRLKGQKSPYDGDWAYWTQRLSEYTTVKREVTMLMKKQKGKCTLCNQYFTSEDNLEIDHIIPQVLGGKNNMANKQLLHKYCHHRKTTNDGSRERKQTS